VCESPAWKSSAELWSSCCRSVGQHAKQGAQQGARQFTVEEGVPTASCADFLNKAKRKALSHLIRTKAQARMRPEQRSGSKTSQGSLQRVR
jgi:hypothetical protein